MNFFKNILFSIKAKRTPKLTDTKTRKKLLEHNQTDQKLVASLSNKKIPTFKQVKYLGKLLTVREKLAIKIFTTFVIVGVIFIGINSYLNLSNVAPAKGGKYTEALVGSPQFINPILAQTNDVDLDLSSILFNGLMQYTPGLGLVEDLAESYSISEDQKVYTFVLRKDVYWHDGQLFTADDVIFTFSRINDPNAKSPLYFNFKGTTVEKIDDFTIRFILTEPFAPFLENLTVGIIPAHVWKNIPVQNSHLSDLNLKPIGTGPYQFASLTKDNKTGEIKSYTLERNNGYFDGPANIDKIIFKFYPNFDLAIEALNNKNVQAMSFLPKEKQDRIINDRSLNYQYLNLPQYTAIFFNQKENTLLKNQTLRKILAHGIDKDKLVSDVLNSEAQKIEGTILRGQLGYTDDYPKYPFDIEYAKGELEKLDWKLATYEVEAKEGETTETYPFQVRKKNSTYLELGLTTVNLPENVDIAKAIQKTWQLLGVKTNIKLVEPDNIAETLKNRDYEILLYGAIIGYDPDPFAFWHSSQAQQPGLNLSQFTNNNADKLLSDARKTTNIEEREKDYIAFQKIIAEEVPAVFLYNPTYTYPQTNKILGFENHTIVIPANRLANIEKWYIKTDRKFN
ncbi:hypothetical protein A2533_03895 [Candidatus Falkowbacteria bacterium RIFOXYD2_FULL_35_9]|nr:MAG: hypothetical protein A2533_03895 [Candidatus Falkowbacteria bacterium RIFOXYD2_FULL_35_9]